MELSPLATKLLERLRESPSLLRYDTDTLGSMFRSADVERLDQAYRDLEAQGLVERAGAYVSFFGKPKPLYRLTSRGRSAVESAP